MHKEVINIDVNKIVPNLYQPRKYFDEEALNELSQSIRQHGIIQPITVRVLLDQYELVAGERRWRAAQLAGLKVVPCTVIDITDRQSAEIALLENLQREDLNYLEEAEAYYNLINEHKFTQEQLAERMGKKQSTIANKLRLLKLSPSVREKCLENNLTERHSRALLSLPNKELQLKILDKIIKKSLNVKASEELINKELLRLAGVELNSEGKKKILGSFPSKIYVNSIKQIFDKFKIPAQYKIKEHEEYVQIIVNIPKNSTKK